MSSIGDITVFKVRGDIKLLRTRVEVWAVAGLDGYGAIQLGAGDAESDIEILKFEESSEAADDDIDSLNDLQGEITTVVNDYGNTFSNALIKEVGQPIKITMIAPSGGTLVKGVWLIVPLKVVIMN
jgi:hypothetical protein